MDFPRPAPCPRCQQDMIWPGRIRLVMKPNYYSVECLCGWSGPVANTEVNAAIRWNQRSAECWEEFEKAFGGAALPRSPETVNEGEIPSSTHPDISHD